MHIAPIIPRIITFVIGFSGNSYTSDSIFTVRVSNPSHYVFILLIEFSRISESSPELVDGGGERPPLPQGAISPKRCIIRPRFTMTD